MKSWLLHFIERIKRSNFNDYAQPDGEGLAPIGYPKFHSQIFKSVTSFTLKSAFVAGCGAIVGIFVYRLLGPTELGKLSLIMTVASTAGGFLGLGLFDTLAKFVPQRSGANEKSALYTKSLANVSIAFGVCTILYFTSTNLLPNSLPTLPEEIEGIGLPFILLVGLYALLSVNKGMLRGIGRFGILPKLSGIQDLIPRIIALPILFYVVSSYKVVFYNVFLFQLIVLGITFYLLKPYLNIKTIRALKDLKLEKQLITFSLIMLGGSVLYMACRTVDMVLLRAMMNSAEVGYYTAGTQVPFLIQSMFLSPLAVPLLYYFSHPESASATSSIIKYGTRVVGFLAGLASLLVLALADKLIPLVLGTEYLNSIPVLQIFSVQSFLVGILAFGTPYFLSINKPHITTIWIAGSVFGLNFIFDLILIPHMGASGAALAQIIAMAIATVIYVTLLKRFGISLTVVLPLAAIFGLSFLVSFKVHLFLGIPIYLAAGFLTRLVRKDDIKEVYLWLKRKGG